ncbi:MAG: hypothetical protein AAF390_02845 [Pseudomonadota bacterium]
MIRSILALSFALAGPAMAQDFSENSEARSWNLFAEVPARFTAVVSDPLCELAGQCADDCGGGARQLVLIREADDAMIFPLKNSQPAFTGAVAELAPFCGQQVEVDGLMIDDPEIGASNVYLVQTIRAVGDEEWIKANTWTKKWADENPEAAGDGPWFRRDPRILAEIEEEGYLGIGEDADQAFFEDWF